MKIKFLGITALLVLAVAFFLSLRNQPASPTDVLPEITVAIAPYQDLAMLVNAEPAGIARANGIKIRLTTMAWEDILPAIGSSRKTVDVGFGSLTEYMTKYSKLNKDNSDPIVFFQPLYVYKGGGFVTLNANFHAVSKSDLNNAKVIEHLFASRIGAQKFSIYEMMLYSIAQRADVTIPKGALFDMPMNDGLLALESNSLDLTAAGLTQLNEARKRGGHMVLSMETAGFADVTGFIARESVLKSKPKEVNALIRSWFASVDYVLSDMQSHSSTSLDYLRKNAATQYTFQEYKEALDQEYLPRSIEDLTSGMLSPDSQYNYYRICKDINSYLLANKIASALVPLPEPLLNINK